MSVVDWLIRRAERTPYFELRGYMRRLWLVPPRERRPVSKEELVNNGISPKTYVDHTGPVRFRERPIAWILQRFNVDARIHMILRSDAERACHCHPTSYVSVILRNRYMEKRYDANGEIISAKVHGPGSILFRRASDRHKLVLVDGPPVVTLFIRGRKVRDWGFTEPGGEYIPWRDYEGR